LILASRWNSAAHFYRHGTAHFWHWGVHRAQGPDFLLQHFMAKVAFVAEESAYWEPIMFDVGVYDEWLGHTAVGRRLGLPSIGCENREENDKAEVVLHTFIYG
jgi:hypothetical protein